MALLRVGGRWLTITAATVAVVVFAVVATGISWQTAAHRWWIDWPLRLWGVGVLVPGVIVWKRATNSRLGQLMVAAAGIYYLQFLLGSRQPDVFAIGFCLAYLWTAIAAHLVLAWPSGRILHRGQRVVVAVCYLASVGAQTARYLIDRPRPPWAFGIPQPNTPAARVGSILFAGLTFIVVSILIRRWATASRLSRRPSEPVWGAIAVASALAAGVGAASAASASGRVQIPLLVAAQSAALLRGRRTGSTDQTSVLIICEPLATNAASPRPPAPPLAWPSKTLTCTRPCKPRSRRSEVPVCAWPRCARGTPPHPA